MAVVYFYLGGIPRPNQMYIGSYEPNKKHTRCIPIPWTKDKPEGLGSLLKQTNFKSLLPLTHGSESTQDMVEKHNLSLL